MNGANGLYAVLHVVTAQKAVADFAITQNRKMAVWNVLNNLSWEMILRQLSARKNPAQVSIFKKI